MHLVKPSQLPEFTLVCIIAGLDMKAHQIVTSLGSQSSQAHLISAPAAAKEYIDRHHSENTLDESLYPEAVSRTVVGLGPLMALTHVNAVVSDFPACPKKCRELFKSFPSAKIILHVLDIPQNQSILGLIHEVKELVKHSSAHDIAVVAA